MPAPRYNRPVIAIIIIGIVGAITTWALAPYLLGFFVFGMLAAAMTITVIQNKSSEGPKP